MAAHLWKRIMQPFVAHCSLLIARCSLQSGAQERTERETQTDQAVIQFVSRVFLKEKQNKQTNAKRIIKEKRKKKDNHIKVKEETKGKLVVHSNRDEWTCLSMKPKRLVSHLYAKGPTKYLKKEIRNKKKTKEKKRRLRPTELHVSDSHPKAAIRRQLQILNFLTCKKSTN